MFNTSKFGRRRAVAVASLMAASALAAPAFAQEQSDAEPADSNVIIVTAQMREQNVQDIPLAITAVSGAMLEARGQTNIAEISAQAPNVVLQMNPSGFGNSMRAFIRGVGQNQNSPSLEPGVGIYVDDIYFGTVTASAFDLVDLERVEVLRGPQGTLAGMNSMGGSVKLYSKKPIGEGGFVEATVGTNGRRDFKASADLTIVEDAVFARITGVTRNQDGHVKQLDYACVHPNDPFVLSGAIPRLAPAGDCQLGDFGNKQMYGMRGSLRIAPTGSPLEINLIGDYSKDTSNTQASVLLASAEVFGLDGVSLPYQHAPFDNRFVPYGKYREDSVINDPYVSYANFYDPGLMYAAADAVGGAGGAPGAPLGPYKSDPRNAVEGWGVSGAIDYQLSDNLALKSITGYRKYQTLTAYDNDNSPIVFLMGEDNLHHKQFSEELRLSGSFADGRVNATIGGTYYDATTVYFAVSHAPFAGFGPPDKPTFAFLNNDVSNLTSYAGFANVSWDLTDALTLEGGIRATHEAKDYTFARLNPNGIGDYLPLSNPANPLTGFVGSWSGTTLDFRAVASYKFTPDVMGYAQFSTGHKAGGISAYPYTYQQIRGFGPEKLRSYELGFKADILDRRVRVNGAAFYMDYIGYVGTPDICLDEDGQQLPPDQGGTPGLCGQFLNLADATVKGFELETFLEPVDGFTIDASLSLNKFKFGKPYYSTTSVVEGASRPGIGDWKWSLGAQYEIPLGKTGTLTPRVDVAYTPGYCGDFACTETGIVDSYTIANARLTFETADGDWKMALEASNLFDKIYYLNKFANIFYATGQIGRPQEFALTVTREF
jgi:iron complex outermembrane receptor protein